MMPRYPWYTVQPRIEFDEYTDAEKLTMAADVINKYVVCGKGDCECDESGMCMPCALAQHLRQEAEKVAKAEGGAS